MDGLALAPPVAVFEATRLDFGDVGLGALHTRQLTITNVGGADLLITPPSVVEDPGEVFSSHVDDTVVLPGQSTALTVQLQPDALGVTRGIVLVQTDDPAAAKVYVEVVARVIIY